MLFASYDTVGPAAASPHPSAAVFTSGQLATAADTSTEITAYATVAVAIVTAILVVVPLAIWWFDRVKRTATAREQLRVVLNNILSRVGRLAENPAFSPQVLTAGLEVLLARAFEGDVGGAVSPAEMAAIYPALVEGHDLLAEAADWERMIRQNTLDVAQINRARVAQELSERAQKALGDKALAVRDRLAEALKALERPPNRRR